MAKHPESDFIDQFVWHVEEGLIAAEDGSSGPPVLKRMTEALLEILNGADPDDALSITRKDGAPRDPFLDVVAERIHDCLADGDSWSKIRYEVSDLYEREERKLVSEQRLKTIYAIRKAVIERRRSIQQMRREIDDATKRS